jgi:hypothetical protein
MAQNELLNILNPEAAPFLSMPPIELGPIATANIPRFNNEPKPYSINTNAIGLLGHVLQEVIMEGEVRNLQHTLSNFSARAEFPGPGGSYVNMGYNVPTGLGYNNDWEVGLTVPFDL